MTVPFESAAQWFDQFPPGDPAMDTHKRWCGRHWAPCPELNYNGLVMSLRLMNIWISEFAENPDPKDTERMNRQLEETGRICCKLGDQRMFELWAECPLAQAQT